MSDQNRRQFFRDLLAGAASIVGTGIVFTKVVPSADAEDRSNKPQQPSADPAARADELLADQGESTDLPEAYTNFRRGGFRRGGFRNGGFRNAGFRNAGFRNGGFRKAGFRKAGFRNF